jgi:hypothetical protein
LIKRGTATIVLLMAAIALAACAPSKKMGATALVPAGMAYAEGREIYFIHTEASDSDVAQLLTEMMDSPVLWVPSLVDAPASALANVYVFTNGVDGMGPLGFAADVFDNPPGVDGYTPLRRLVLVTWAEPDSARVLKSAAEVLDAVATGAVTLEDAGVVINMPFVVWDGGKR